MRPLPRNSPYVLRSHIMRHVARTPAAAVIFAANLVP